MTKRRPLAARIGKLMRVMIGLTAVMMFVTLWGCADTRSPSRGSPSLGREGGVYKIGNPYQINGVWYYPAVDYDYSETGVASWYGSDFHGKSTANGELYDMNELSAAHRTLPLPSIVQVTNLENGRALKLRVNDRGPFAKGRIIDVSRRASQLLGFHTQGTTRVKVEIVPDESKELAEQLTEPMTPRKENNQIAEIREVGEVPVGQRQSPFASGASWVTTEDLPPVGDAPLAESAVWKATAPDSQQPDAAAIESLVTRGAYIQAGAFSDPNNAVLARTQLAHLGPVKVTPHRVNGRDLFRVRLGPLASVGEANRLLAAVIQAGYPGSRVINE